MTLKNATLFAIVGGMLSIMANTIYLLNNFGIYEFSIIIFNILSILNLFSAISFIIFFMTLYSNQKNRKKQKDEVQ